MTREGGDCGGRAVVGGEEEAKRTGGVEPKEEGNTGGFTSESTGSAGEATEGEDIPILGFGTTPPDNSVPVAVEEGER